MNSISIALGTGNQKREIFRARVAMGKGLVEIVRSQIRKSRVVFVEHKHPAASI